MDRTGQQFGKYRLIRLLGQGGFAEVYLGEHVLMKSLAAIKILPNQITPADSQVFLQEARTLVALEHPHIVGVKDCDVQDGIPFIIMDYAPNGTLCQRHPKGTRVLLANAISYVSQIAPALQHAHNLNLIHRDVKPENMLLGRDDQVLLSDFGIAVIFSTALSRYAKDSAGTAIYMAPEQIMGKPRPASDQYSLAIVVYEWLCGATPFRGTQLEITSQHLHAPPPPIYAQGVNIPPAVEAVVMKALAKQPEDRFPSVQDFALALWNSNPQQQTQHRNVVTSSDPSIFLSPSDRSAQYTHTPLPSQPPQISPGIIPANPTPHLTPPIQPFPSPGATPQLVTPPVQQPIPGSTPHMLPPTMPGQYLTPTVPGPTPTRRSKAGCVIGSVVSIMLVAALVTGLVIFLPQILSQAQKNNPTGPDNTPGTSATQVVTPPPGQTQPVDVSGASSTMDTFCSYLNSGAIQQAYNLTSQNYQSQHSIGEFSNQFNDPDLFTGGCLHSSPTGSNGNVTIPFSFTKYNLGSPSTVNYTATLVQGSQGWVIDNIV
jgi:serine/threonine protein kinase